MRRSTSAEYASAADFGQTALPLGGLSPARSKAYTARLNAAQRLQGIANLGGLAAGQGG